MKYLYSLLIILTGFVALPTVVDYTTNFASHICSYVSTGSFKEEAPETKKARDNESWADNTAYTNQAVSRK